MWFKCVPGAGRQRARVLFHFRLAKVILTAKLTLRVRCLLQLSDLSKVSSTAIFDGDPLESDHDLARVCTVLRDLLTFRVAARINYVCQ